jgi:nicotinamidase-related amidase
MREPILLVIDLLNDFLDSWPGAARDRLLRSTNELIALMRSANHRVVWVRQEFEPDLHDAFPEMRAKGIRINIRGTRGAQIAPELNIDPADAIVIKKRYSAFFGTNLDQLLTGVGVDAVILAGINTHACIRMTAIDAYQRDIPVILAADCIDSYDREHHQISMRYMKDKIAAVLTNEEIASALASDPG